jgi:hypothetical protein
VKRLYLLGAALVVVGLLALLSGLHVDQLPSPIGRTFNLDVPRAPERPPRPTPEPRATHPPGWVAPTWPQSSSPAAAQPQAPRPEFATTTWVFPTFDDLFDLYWDAPLHSRYAREVAGTASELRQVARNSARELANACNDAALRKYLIAAGNSHSPICIPVLVHLVRVDGREAWVVVSAWEVPPSPKVGRLSPSHIAIDVLEPGTGRVLNSKQCG